MGIVCSTCTHDDAKSAPTGDSFHEPLVASDRDAGAAGSLAELEAHNAALARQRVWGSNSLMIRIECIITFVKHC